jgi:hypothetical protein
MADDDQDRQEQDQDAERAAVRERFRAAMDRVKAISDGERDEEVRVVREWAAARRLNAA